jgi:ABC-type multidrug transport system fused ATPase/permease subunit
VISEYRTLLKAIGSGRMFLFLLILRAPFDIANTVVNALFLQSAFDSVGRGDAAGLANACLSFGIACMCLFLYNGVVWSFYAPFAARMECKLRITLLKRISSLSCERVDATASGEWLTRLNMDVEAPFSRAVHLPHLACAAVNIVASSVVLWLANPAVFGWVIIFVIPHMAVNHLLIARAMPALNERCLEAAAINTGELTAFITCADISALYDGQGYLLERFERSSLDLLKANMRIRTRTALSAGILPLFGLGGYLTLLIASSAWIAAGRFTFGGLTAAFTYRGGVLAGALMLINCLISIQSSMAGIRRINETLSEKTEEQYG